MRWAIVLSVGLVAAATGCAGSNAPAASVAPAAPVVTVTVTAPAPPPRTPATGGSGTASWTMPDFVGSTLQDAQNGVQDLTDFEIAVTTSHDSTGAGRQQLVDRNWKVCSQSIPPGTTITASTKIDFGSVQLGENCR